MTKQLKEMTQKELKELLDEKYEEFEELAKSIRKETNYDVPVLNFFGVSDKDIVLGFKYVSGTILDLLNLVHDDNDFKRISLTYLLASGTQEQESQEQE